ncbi:hypothetical protein SFRURICE_021197 [Spodoptera frugiperda]|nr:hypothetical protein SFRURICE_021197 [Spodoptera frugiperda]
MAHELSELIVSLKDVRKYLIKIGPSRRTGNIIQIKLQEVDSLCTQYSKILEKIEDIKGSIKEDEYLFIKKTCEQFDSLHKEILNLCSVQTKQLSNMAKFDLKADDEDSIKRLIDGIDYYSSELDDESQRRLVNFVLKNRLSQAAKLKLCSTYGSVSALLCDMKNQLLPKKSTTSIQRKLYNFRQNDLSIDEFEGLRNRRLSTLISARNYTSLKDAVQAAVDEETSSPSTSGDVMYINAITPTTIISGATAIVMAELLAEVCHPQLRAAALQSRATPIPVSGGAQGVAGEDNEAVVRPVALRPKLTSELEVENQMLKHKFYVFQSLPCKTSGIIGNDFLNKYKSILNFGNNTLLLWNNNMEISLPLYFPNTSINIPARCESVHMLHTYETEESVICTSRLSEGVFIASALVKPINGMFPIRIINTTENDLTLDNINPIIHKATDYDTCRYHLQRHPHNTDVVIH